MLLLHMLFFSIFYPHCYGDHLHLPSFPTRRSSDLSYYVRAWVAAAIVLVQTAVIAASFALDPPVNGTEMIVMVAVYGILQAATVGVALSQRRADAVMRELAAAHVELRTASARSEEHTSE